MENKEVRFAITHILILVMFKQGEFRYYVKCKFILMYINVGTLFKLQNYSPLMNNLFGLYLLRTFYCVSCFI